MDLRRLGGYSTEYGIVVPRPFRAGLPIAGLGVLSLVGATAGLIGLLPALVYAGIFLAAGALQTAMAFHELVDMRRRADHELRRAMRPYLLSALAAWRSAELTSERHRRVLARSVARTERDLSPAKLAGASPLNRIAARPQADLLRQLHERLGALDRPVAARGVLQVEDLLTSPESPLYEREQAGSLRASLRACLGALDGERRDGHIPQGSNGAFPDGDRRGGR